MSEPVKCYNCDGTGRVTCTQCHGSGKCRNCNGRGNFGASTKCTDCNGSGTCPDCHGHKIETCLRCNGKGYVVFDEHGRPW